MEGNVNRNISHVKYKKKNNTVNFPGRLHQGNLLIIMTTISMVEGRWCWWRHVASIHNYWTFVHVEKLPYKQKSIPYTNCCCWPSMQWMGRFGRTRGGKLILPRRLTTQTDNLFMNGIVVFPGTVWRNEETSSHVHNGNKQVNYSF